MNPKYAGYFAGRLEAYEAGKKPKSNHAIWEVRYFTKQIDAFNKFVGKWDFKVVDEKTLRRIRKTMADRFYETSVL